MCFPGYDLPKAEEDANIVLRRFLPSEAAATRKVISGRRNRSCELFKWEVPPRPDIAPAEDAKVGGKRKRAAPASPKGKQKASLARELADWSDDADSDRRESSGPGEANPDDSESEGSEAGSRAESDKRPPAKK